MSRTARASLLASFVVLAIGAALLVASVIYTHAPGENANASLGGPFTLVDDDGAPRTQQLLENKVTLLFFGYTHCPDVCPTTLFELAQLKQALGADADKVQVVFATVDPERDTPKVMKDYIGSFDKSFIGLTGTPDQIAKFAKEWRAYYKKVPGENGDYTMDHTAIVYLLDRKGHFNSVLNLTQGTQAAAAAVRKVI